jgi:hypothetical protein
VGFDRAAICASAAERNEAQANENTAHPSDESEASAVSCASIGSIELNSFSAERTGFDLAILLTADVTRSCGIKVFKALKLQ